jgi:Icc protein
MPKESSAGGATINLLQITDCHLTKEVSGELLGVNTRESLDAVLDLIQDNITRNIHEKPDYILATGDLAQDASVEAYQYFNDKMAAFDCPVSWFPGNHDSGSVMAQVVSKEAELNKVIQTGDWQFVLLDSSVAGSVHGFLDKEDLAVLEQTLSDNPDRHTMVCLHHHPIDIESAWLDKIGLHNRDQLFEILDKYSNVKAILWGHIHQELDSSREGVSLFATPSTCIQFLPKSNGFAVDNVAPGYRWLSLHANGEITTEVVRAKDYVFHLDLESTGY